MIAPQTISGNNKKQGIYSLFIAYIFIIATIIIAYVLFYNENFREVLNQNESLPVLILILYILIGVPFLVLILWQAMNSFQPKTLVFNPQKVQFLINENLQWESDYPHISRVTVRHFTNHSALSAIKQIDVITVTNQKTSHHIINFKHFSPDKLAEIIKAFKVRKIRLASN